MATRTWLGLGIDNNWTTSGNWDVTPVAGDDLVFGGSMRTSPNNDFAAATSFASITFATGAAAFTLTAGNSITLTGDITNSSSNTQTINIGLILNVATCTIAATSGAINVAGIISQTGGARTVTKTGTSSLTLGGSNTFSGGFGLTAGTVVGNVSASFGTGTVTCTGGTTITGTLGNNPVYANAFVLNGTLTVYAPFSGGYDVELAGVISGTGGLALVSDASGRRMYLSNSNTFSGGVTLGAGSNEAGRLHIGTSTSLGSGVLTIDQSGASGIEAQVNGLTVANSVVVNSGKTFFLQKNVATMLTLTGVISGAGGVNCGGLATLSGASTYTGTTVVASGVLTLTGSLASGSAVTVNSGGTLSGTGTINGSITCASGGIAAPGTGGTTIGTLATAAVTLQAGSTFSVDLNGAGPTADQIASVSTISLAGGLTIASLIPSAGRSFTILSATTSITGTFTGKADGSVFSVNGNRLRINYNATTVTLTSLTRTSQGFAPMFMQRSH